jgi:NADH-quinone oxidoreductase subunit J
MLIGAEKMSHVETLRWQRPLAFILAAALSVEVAYLAVRQSTLLQPAPVKVDPDFGGPAAIGLVIFKDYALPFEVVSILLLVAMVGAIVLTVHREKKK